MVPPDTREGEGDDEFSIDWEQLSAQQQQTEYPQPLTEYPLKLTNKKEDRDGKDEEEEVSPVLPLICHRVKVQRYCLLAAVK